MSVDIQVDLRPRFGMARDQGHRLTCVAFAGSDCHAAMRSGPFSALSVEYAFYRAVLRKGGIFDPGAGVPLRHLLGAIENDGQPVEADWPYLAETPATLSEYTPPATTNGVYKRASKYGRVEVDVICQTLGEGVPSLVVFWPTMNFHAAKAGVVVRSSASDRPTGMLHAVVAVGWGMDNLDKVICVRNSWGAGWADSGHAWISGHYLQPLLHDVVMMER